MAAATAAAFTEVASGLARSRHAVSEDDANTNKIIFAFLQLLKSGWTA